MNEKAQNREKKSVDRSKIIQTVILICVAFLLTYMGILVEPHIKVVELLAVVFGVLLIILVLLWLPYRVAESTRECIAEIMEKLDYRFMAELVKSLLMWFRTIGGK